LEVGIYPPAVNVRYGSRADKGVTPRVMSFLSLKADIRQRA
jgi:hypothetical protein